MTEAQILGIAIPIVIGLIGLIYRILAAGQKENKDNIKDLDRRTDTRLDKAEKDIVELKTKINK